ncbi:MAG: hypothetical protein ACXWZF_08605 [Actinomycetota bacterium]
MKVDVCVNGAEARSNFKYGRAFELGTGIPAGTYKVKVRLASPRECMGQVAISDSLEFTDGLKRDRPRSCVRASPPSTSG